MDKKNTKDNKKVCNKGVSFCFTDYLPNNIENGYEKIYEEYKDVIRGIAWGLETCPTTGRKHNQAYIQMFKQCRFSAIQKMIKSKAHFKVMKGSIIQNEDYCKKEGNYKKIGLFVSRGYRSDLHNIKDDLKNGASLYDIMENYTGDYIRYHSGIEKMKKLIERKKSAHWRDVEVTALYGKAGSGKTSHVIKKHGYDNVFIWDSKMASTDFWGHYDGEDVLLIDDFNGWVQYSYLLRVLDGHQLHLNIKGSGTFARWTKVYITSNNMGYRWYKSIGENLSRRFNKCLKVSKGNTESLTHEEFFGECVDDDEDNYGDDF